MDRNPVLSKNGTVGKLEKTGRGNRRKTAKRVEKKAFFYLYKHYLI